MCKQDCFYCTYCQRIKVSGIHVDWYCEKHLCLTDDVKNCKEFVHVGADNKPPNDVIEFDGSFASALTGISIGDRHFTASEIYKMLFELRIDRNSILKERKLLATALFDVSRKYKDYEYVSKILEETENRRR